MTQRSPISPSTGGGSRNNRLSVIAEDGASATPVASRARDRTSDTSFTLPLQGTNYVPSPVQASHRPSSRKWTDKPPHHSADASPPGYQHWDETTPTTRRQLLLEKVRGNAQIAKRGGWKRLCIILLVLLAIIIALAVGLGVGLNRRNQNNSSSDNTDNSNSTQAFPAGSYAINVYSAVASAACTSIASTWRCYPYNTYDSSNPSNSLATYNWIINSAGSSSSSSSSQQAFNISTTNNPFADIFTNIPLTLENAGTAEEFYSFSIPLTKSVVPTTSIAPSGQTTTCYFNNTILTAALYTRKPSANITTSSSSATTQQSTNAGSNLAANNWQSWPYAVNVTQSIGGGVDVPNCYEMNSDGSRGARVTTGLTQQSASSLCVCGYRNFGF